MTQEVCWRPFLAAALALPMATPVLADSPPERASVSVKVLDYADRQPDADRVNVRSPALHLTMPLAGRWRLDAGAVSDSISGASPAYHSVALGHFSDRRRAGDLTVTRYFDDATLAVGAAHSSEADYRSDSLSVQGTLSSDDRNTTWNAGLGVSRDRVDPVNHVVSNERKAAADVVFGLTQVLSPHDVLQLSLGHARQRGYLSDPYKALDRRPRTRDATRVLLRWNHHIPSFDAALRGHYRFWRDNWGVRTHTLGLEYAQPLGRSITLTPSVRWYSQSAARFYVDVDPAAGPFLPQPPPGALYSTLDHRMSAFGARSAAMKVQWRIATDWTADLKFEHYEQRGSWRLGGSGSPGLMPVRARIWQLGLVRFF
jgi:hypothetical protein